MMSPHLLSPAATQFVLGFSDLDGSTTQYGLFQNADIHTITANSYDGARGVLRAEHRRHPRSGIRES